MIMQPEAMSTGDPDNYIGHSLYSSDPTLAASIDEFRIYNGPLTAGQIRADAALGPNELIGTNTDVSLGAAVSTSTIAITWPTNSAPVTLWSSPTLGPSAVWTQVANPMTLNGGNYQVTVPISDSARFFRLSQ